MQLTMDYEQKRFVFYGQLNYGHEIHHKVPGKPPRIHKIKYKLSGSIVEYDEEVYTDCHGEEQDAAEAEYDEKLDEFCKKFGGEAPETFLDVESANKHARGLNKNLVKSIQASSSLFPMEDERI